MAPTPDQADVIEQALADLINRRERYQLYRAYYDGAHRIAFASSRYQRAFAHLFEGLADNLAASVVDTAADRLQVTSFAVEDGPAQGGELAWALWERNRMDRRADEIHLETLRQGDGYCVVWPDAEGQATIYPQRADCATVAYDEEVPGRVLWGAKGWLPRDGHYRLTVYYPDRVEKWRTTQETQGGIPDRADTFEPYRDPDAPEGLLENRWDTVPMFHWANNAPVGTVGASELRDVIPLQDGLNKTLMDLLTSSEMVALPQRYAVGLEVEMDPATGEPKFPFTPGVERIWAVGDPNVKFGQFDSEDMAGHLKMLEMFRMEIARVSSTPLHFFMLMSGNWPSGEALRTSESRFLAKITDRMASFGNVWENVMAFAVQVQHDLGELRLITNWEDPAPVSQLELTQTLEVKQRLGVPWRQLMTELGYPEETINTMERDRQAEEERAAELQTRRLGASMLEFNAGR